MGKPTPWLVAGAIVIGVVFFSYKNFETVETKTINIRDMVELVRKTLAEVEQKTKTGALPDFQHADLEITSVRESSRESTGSVVLLSGSTDLKQSTSTLVRIRLRPGDTDVAASPQELAALILESLREAKAAAEPDLVVGGLTLTFAIGVKASAKGKVQLKAEDLAFSAGHSRARGTRNKITLFFAD